MKKGVLIPIIVTTVYLLIYTFTPHLSISAKVIIALFVFSPFLMIWMVLSILIKGEPSKKKFSDGHWYEDVNKVYSRDA
ncbi:hypothetical protein [uncultured Microscilla sp.]|uniref:hypothetical protein n=1 Tax=uncultured Microscilla sp. TaxID=432653 RepID=UPI0026197D33|nr:hypothetical protein [uncultured Microscilla sp.]